MSTNILIEIGVRTIQEQCSGELDLNAELSTSTTLEAWQNRWRELLTFPLTTPTFGPTSTRISTRAPVPNRQLA